MIQFPKFVRHFAFYTSFTSGPLYELFVYDLEEDTPDGRSLGYRLRQFGEIVFEGEDLSCAPDEMALDSTAYDIMEMLCTGEGEGTPRQALFYKNDAAALWAAVQARWPKGGK